MREPTKYEKSPHLRRRGILQDTTEYLELKNNTETEAPATVYREKRYFVSFFAFTLW